MRSKVSAEAFRAAAKRLFPNTDSVAWGSIDRLADGGVFVEVQVFVSEAEAQAEAETIKREAEAEAAKKALSCS